jgi:hypothetical protein
VDVIGEFLDETFGGRWLPFITAVGAYVVYALKLYEKSSDVKGSPLAQEWLERIRMWGGLAVTTAAVILAGRAVFGDFKLGFIGLFAAVGAAVVVGIVLLRVARRDRGTAVPGGSCVQPGTSDA